MKLHQGFLGQIVKYIFALRYQLASTRQWFSGKMYIIQLGDLE